MAVAAAVEGPFTPCGPIMPAMTATDVEQGPFLLVHMHLLGQIDWVFFKKEEDARKMLSWM